MISSVLNHLWLSVSESARTTAPCLCRGPAVGRFILACAGILSAAVLAPGPVLAQYSASQGPGDASRPYTGPLDGPEASGCLQARSLSSVVASNDRQVVLRFGGTSYRVRLTKACPALVKAGANVAGVTRSTGGIICQPFDVELKVVSSDGSVSYCTGASIYRFSKADVAAPSAPVQP